MNYNFYIPNKLENKALLLAIGNSFYKNIRILIAVIVIFIGRKTTNKEADIIGLTSAFSIFALIFIANFLYHFIKHKTFRYQIINDELVVTKGWLQKSKTVVKKSKIIEVHLKQNFIHKIVGLYLVIIETAGSERVEISIVGVDYEKALAFKEALLAEENLFNEEVVLDKEIPKISKQTIVSISWNTLLKMGLTRNHLQSIGLIVAFSYNIFETIKDLFFTGEKLSDSIDQLLEVDYSAVIWTITIVFLLLGILIFNIVRTFLQYYGYKIENINNKMVASYGLLNSNIVSVPADKIQMFRIQQNYFQKIIQLFEIEILQIGSTNNKKKKNSGLTVPAVNTTEMQKIFDFIYNDTLDKGTYFFRPNYRKFIVESTLTVGALLLVFTPLYYFDILPFLWIYALIITLPTLYCYLSFRFEKLYLKDDFVILQKGVWDKDTFYLHISKIQSVKVSQSFFQKRTNFTSATLYTASKSLTIGYYDADLIKKLANEILGIIEGLVPQKA